MHCKILPSYSDNKFKLMIKNTIMNFSYFASTSK